HTHTHTHTHFSLSCNVDRHNAFYIHLCPNYLFIYVNWWLVSHRKLQVKVWCLPDRKNSRASAEEREEPPTEEERREGRVLAEPCCLRSRYEARWAQTSGSR